MSFFLSFFFINFIKHIDSKSIFNYPASPLTIETSIYFGLSILNHVVKVKNSQPEAQFSSPPQNVTMEDSQWKTKENETIGAAFKTMNFHRTNMNEFLYRKFLLSSLMSRKKGLTNKNRKFNQTERRRPSDRIYNAELNRYKSWLIGSKGSKTKGGIYLQNFTSYLPTAVDKVETMAKDKDISTGTAFSTDHGNVMPLRNYTYPPILYKKKHNKIIINGLDPKGILQSKIYPPTVNKLSRDQLKSLGAILLKNRYFANRIIGEQRQKNSESDNINGDYTVNLPSADYGSPIYTTNMATENTILYITTEAPITPLTTDSFYNYANFETSTPTKPINPSISLMEMLNPPNQMISDFSSVSPIPVNSGPYMNSLNAINPIYGLPSQMSSINQPAGNSMNPSFLMNSMNTMNTMTAGSRPMYSVGPGFSFSPDSSSMSDDQLPYIVEDHPHCSCKDNMMSSSSSGDASATDADGNEMDFMDSDIYDAILTTIAFMAFGTYFISMMMKINEKNPGATLMVVENGGNMESGRKFESIHDDFYLNSLMEEVMLFIDGFQELLEQAKEHFDSSD